MKHLLLFLTVLLLLKIPLNCIGQIVINEIRASDGHVEIKNLGASTVAVGNYQLCRFPTYQALNMSGTLVCGSLSLAPGALVTVNLGYTLSAADDELGLYVNGNDFGNSSNIRDYVEWGSHGHPRSSVAEAAGIWTNNDFVPDWSDCVSLEYDGSGNLSGDWETQDVATMPCAENNLNGCGQMPLDLLSFEVKQIDEDAGISWKAVHDATVDAIFLEHSIDQKSWQTISTWYPHGPEFDQGEYMHQNLNSGIHAYRLRTEYDDRSIEYSLIEILRLCYDKDEVTIWPNPTNSKIDVFVQSIDPIDGLEYILVDVHGKVCRVQQGSHQVQLDLTGLQGGMYFLQIPALGIVRRVIKS